jgi:hypothetical protein
MKKIQLLIILLFSKLIACKNPETAPEKLILIENKVTTQKDKNKELANETVAEINSIKNNNTTLFLVSEQKMENRNKKSAAVNFLTEDVQLNQKNPIASGFVRNVLIKEGSNYCFKRVVKQDSDSRVGCSGNESELSFTIINPADTFLIENELLKTLNFQYRINGGLYWEDGKNPFKGYIKGMSVTDNTWQIEINVWIKMTDLQLNKETERQIIVKDKFML